MFDINAWMMTLTKKLCEVFKDRLLFTGLQGSYRRGEATEESDIDVMVVLDIVDTATLSAYQAILAEMPCADKACGFISDKNTLLNWPKYEIFHLIKDTKPYFGSLDGLLPAFTEQDIRDSIRINTANLYHLACHTFLYGKAEPLEGVNKSVFFILQMVYYLQTGAYSDTKKELLQRVTAEEQELLTCDGNWEAYYNLLIRWCQSILINT